MVTIVVTPLKFSNCVGASLASKFFLDQKMAKSRATVSS